MALEILDNETVMARLEWIKGRLSYTSTSELLEPALEVWIRRGISEWLPDSNGGYRPVTTLPSEPEFFERLKLYIERQSGLTVRLTPAQPELESSPEK